MRIMVLGAGGVGGYFGAMLARAGNEVAFVARGRHLEAMREKGLRAHGPRGEIHIPEPRASDDPASLGKADLVLVCVKLYDTDEAARAIRPVLGEGSRVLSLQNGVEGPERLARLLGAERVFGGAAYVSAVIEAPGVIRYDSEMSRIVFGPLGGGEDALAAAFRERCRDSGFAAEVSPEIMVPLWSKMVLLATNAGFSAATRLPIRASYDDVSTLRLVRAAMQEAERVARAVGVNLPEDVVERSIEMASRFPPNLFASMFYDLDRGGRLELDGLSGCIVRLGAEHGIPTPVHETLYAVLKPHRDGRPPGSRSADETRTEP